MSRHWVFIVSSSDTEQSYNVIIVGAGLAGCTAAILYARKGLSVALVERQPTSDSYKQLCTHFLQPGAIPVLKELGIHDEVLAAGGLPSDMHVRTRWGAFTVPHPGRHRGLNIRRSLLDPLMHKTVSEEKNVDCYWGAKVTDLHRTGHRVTGIITRNRQGQERFLSAPLTVAADGRQSAMAGLAGLPCRETPNERFAHYAYFRGLPRYPDNNVQVWIADEGSGYVAAFPNNDDLTLVSCYVPRSRLADWQGRIEQRYLEFVGQQQEGPDLSQGTRVSDIMGMRKMPSLTRPRTLPGLALTGDAAMAIDPLAGIGCTWAMQSARQLVRCTASTLINDRSQARLDAALARYRWQHSLRFGPQFFILSRFSRAKPYHPATRWLLKCVARLLSRSRDRRASQLADVTRQ